MYSRAGKFKCLPSSHLCDERFVFLSIVPSRGTKIEKNEAEGEQLLTVDCARENAKIMVIELSIFLGGGRDGCGYSVKDQRTAQLMLVTPSKTRTAIMFPRQWKLDVDLSAFVSDLGLLRGSGR